MMSAIWLPDWPIFLSDLPIDTPGASIGTMKAETWAFLGRFSFEVRAMIRPTFAKGIGNGLALGGVVARAEIMDCLTANSISTFGGNPLAAAVALANLRHLLDHDLQGNALRVGRHLRERLQRLVDATDGLAELRGKGLMLGIETVVPGGGLTPDAKAAGALLEETRRRGVLIGKGGLYGNVLRITPPLSVTVEEVDQAVDAFAGAVEAVYGRG